MGARLGATAALLPSGRQRSRNYAANNYPFRGVSHFLYLFGLPIREAMALWDGAGWTVFARQPTAQDALWSGPKPGLDELARACGCPFRPIEELAAVLDGRVVATLPAPDLETCREQSRLLNREVIPGRFDERDELLASALIDARLIHDEAAIAELRLATAATVAGHRAALAATRPGITEAAVRGAMEGELIARGMTVSFGSIVTVAGEVLHNEEHHRILGERDLLLVDAGAETAGGWAGDITRTWPVSGRFSSSQRALYDVVLAAHAAAIAAVRPGVRYRDVHLVFCAPDALQIGEDILSKLREAGTSFQVTDDFENTVASADALYMTRVQDEWDTSQESKRIDTSRFQFTEQHLSRLRPEAVILHPLPRRQEIAPEVDRDPRAVYWRQVRNGMWIRSALMLSIFEKDVEIDGYYQDLT